MSEQQLDHSPLSGSTVSLGLAGLYLYQLGASRRMTKQYNLYKLQLPKEQVYNYTLSQKRIDWDKRALRVNYF